MIRIIFKRNVGKSCEIWNSLSIRINDTVYIGSNNKFEKRKDLF